MSFKILDSEDFTFGVDSVASPAWSNYSASLTSFYTSSVQQDTVIDPYYTNVYNFDPVISSSKAEIQFSVAYGDIGGSGSLWYSAAAPSLSPTKTIYKQFTNLLLGEDENNFFDFETSTPAKGFFAITINRARYKQSILPGSLQIRGLIDNREPIYITDNSKLTSSLAYTNAGRRYTLGSGSFGDGVMPSSATAGVYGYLYPDAGIILLNPASFDISIQNEVWKRPDNSNRYNNARSLVSYITQFTLQSQETIPSAYIFCRARNNEFNFSTQTNFISSTRNITGSSNVINNDFIKTPPTYITSVGLYNDNHDLLAVAKLSKPLKKDFTLEALIRVKLDF
jgi:hypothetical protein